MRLDFLLLADAISEAEGKLYIHGAGITRLTVPAFPWSQPQLSLVARFAIEDEVDLSKHTISFKLADPLGHELAPPLVATIDLAASSEASRVEGREFLEGEAQYFQVVLTLHSLRLEQPGVYNLIVVVDDREVERMSIPVVASTGASTEV